MLLLLKKGCGFIHFYEEMVVRELVEQYKISKRKALELVEKSYLRQALEKFPDVVLNDPIESWVYEIGEKYEKDSNHI